MKNLSRLFAFLLLFVASNAVMTGCEVIGDIFGAGVWVGVILVLLVVGLLVFVISKLR